MGFGTITLKDRHNKTADVTIGDVADLATVEVFETDISTHTHAVPYIRSYSETINDFAAPAAGDLDSVEIKAVIRLRDPQEPNRNRQKFNIELPAPYASLFEGKMDQGSRVIPAQGQAIVTAINNALGTTYEFVLGYLDARRHFKSI